MKSKTNHQKSNCQIDLFIFDINVINTDELNHKLDEVENFQPRSFLCKIIDVCFMNTILWVVSEKKFEQACTAFSSPLLAVSSTSISSCKILLKEFCSSRKVRCLHISITCLNSVSPGSIIVFHNVAFFFKTSLSRFLIKRKKFLHR